jgi:hypothetical protein
LKLVLPEKLECIGGINSVCRHLVDRDTDRTPPDSRPSSYEKQTNRDPERRSGSASWSVPRPHPGGPPQTREGRKEMLQAEASFADSLNELTDLVVSRGSSPRAERDALCEREGSAAARGGSRSPVVSTRSKASVIRSSPPRLRLHQGEPHSR